MFYRLHDKDSSKPDRWYLKAPTSSDGRDVDPRLFTGGVRIEAVGALYIPIRRAGTPMDFTMADFELPILASRFGDALERVAGSDIQRIPISVEGARTEYEIVNVVSVVDCLDETASEIAYWPSDGGVSTASNRYLAITRLRVDPERIIGEQIFRLDGWKPAVIVSHAVRRVLEGAAGACFEQVV